MPLIKSSVAVAAGASVTNVLSGSTYEFLSGPATIEVGLLASAAGLVASVSSGSDILLDDGSAVDVVRVANQGPIYPEDFALTDMALGGDRLRISVRNPTGGAITFFYAVKITPMG